MLTAVPLTRSAQEEHEDARHRQAPSPGGPRSPRASPLLSRRCQKGKATVHSRGGVEKELGTQSPAREPRRAKFGRGGGGTRREARGQAWGPRVPRARTHPARRAATWPRRRAAAAAPQRRAAPSLLSAGAAPPPAVRPADRAAPHGPRRRPRSPLPRSRPAPHGRSKRRKELRLRRQTGDWARPRGAIAAKPERLASLSGPSGRAPCEGLGGTGPRGHAPRPIHSRPVCRPRPSGARRLRGPPLFS